MMIPLFSRRLVALMVGGFALSAMFLCCPFGSSSNGGPPTPTANMSTGGTTSAPTTACSQWCYGVARWSDTNITGGQVTVTGQSLACNATNCAATQSFLNNAVWLGQDGIYWVEAGYGLFYANGMQQTQYYWTHTRPAVSNASNCISRGGEYVAHILGTIQTGQPITLAITKEQPTAAGATPNTYDVAVSAAGALVAGNTPGMRSTGNCMAPNRLDLGTEVQGNVAALKTSDPQGIDFTNAQIVDGSFATHAFNNNAPQAGIISNNPPYSNWDGTVFHVQQCCEVH